jgi:micrococcal nuclease|tara:strand:+ start:308 stop:835 length:528 start_codon:yes stop_codon:yes gene_type:complete
VAAHFFISAPPAAQAEPKPGKRLTAKITRVFDGYSFQLGAGMRGALIGVASPSRRALGGKESFAFLRNLLEGRTVKLEVDKKLVDTYGQARYYVYLNDGTMVNALILLRGFGRAVIKHPNVRYRKKLLEAEKFAKSFKRGIWGDSFRDPNEDDFFKDKDPFDRSHLFRPRRRRRY